MVTFRCTRCGTMCQVGPSHQGTLHRCEQCGLILSVPAPARPKKAESARRSGVLEMLVAGGVIVCLGTIGVVALTLKRAAPRRVVEAEPVEQVQMPVNAATPVRQAAPPRVEVAQVPAAAPKPVAIPPAEPAPRPVISADLPKPVAKPAEPPVPVRPAPVAKAAPVAESVVVVTTEAVAEAAPVVIVVRPDAPAAPQTAAAMGSAAVSTGGLAIPNFSFEEQQADYTGQVTAWDHHVVDGHLARKICDVPRKQSMHGQKYLELFHDVGQVSADAVCGIRSQRFLGAYRADTRYTLKVMLARAGEGQFQRQAVLSLCTPSGKVATQAIPMARLQEDVFTEYAVVLDTSRNRECVGKEIQVMVEFVSKGGQWGRALDIDHVRLVAEPSTK